MKKIIPFLLFLVIGISFLMNYVNADESTTPMTNSVINADIKITDNQFEPNVWMCDNRIVLDGGDYPGRVSGQDENLIERINNYGFEGEQIGWLVLVMDLDGINNIDDVYTATKTNIDSSSIKSVSCEKIYDIDTEIPASCNARIGEDEISEFDENYMSYYSCKYVIPDFDTLHGQRWITVEVKDKEKLSAYMSEKEFWYFNPIISLSIDENNINFNDLKNGKVSYSNNITIKNTVDNNSGVLMDLFISGTDFYDKTNKYSYCDGFNKLSLSRIKYFASNDNGYDTMGISDSDAEGYRSIKKADSFSSEFYYSNNLIPKDKRDIYYFGNFIAPHQETKLNFKIDIPDRCKGKFDDGSIFIWGEAI